MSNYVKLDNIVHAKTTVDTRPSAQYGDNVNQLRVFVTEFEDLQREYAIFFRKDKSGAFYPVTLLGLDSNENLFLNDIQWDGHYIPAIAQRGPFQIGIPKTGEPIIKIDLENPRVNAPEGVALFEPNGGLSPYLTYVSKLLNKIHVGLEMNDPFFDELTAAALIEPITLDLKLDESNSYSVPELFSINETAFQTLSRETLERFHKSGLLSLCYYVLSSRKNINALIDRKVLKINSSA